MQHDAWISVNVRRPYWGRGIGRILAERVEHWARERKLRRLSTAMSTHNVRAMRFATACGFRQETFSPRYMVLDGHAVDRVRMVKILEGGS